ncbi:MAG: hypothetical protein PHV16_03975 [Candidatus Nanoarchaeia archaeon]|nr:hypothetical protein [Candidatus Nanoarchaeia archaeon]
MENNIITNREIREYISRIKASEKDRLRQNHKKPFYDNNNIEYRLKNYESNLKIRISPTKKVDFILSQNLSENIGKNDKELYNICKQDYNMLSIKRIFFGSYKGVRRVKIMSIYSLDDNKLKRISKYEAKEKKDVTDEHKRIFKNLLMRYLK